MPALKPRSLASGAAIGVAAALAVGAGGYWGHARGEPTASLDTAQDVAPRGAPYSFAGIISRVAPAVVSIEVEKRETPSPVQFGPRDVPSPFGGPDQGQGDDGDGRGQAMPFPFPFGGFGFGNPQGQGQAPQRSRPVLGAGSGFFVSPDGYVVTNNHVVAGADKIMVRTSDGRELKAHLVGRDPATDLAVVKVDGGPFRYVSFETQGAPRVGDWVVALGNPFDLGGTATAGIVSALSRPNISGSSYVDYMQIDAPINRGNSGGPTFDVDGRVVGVNSAIFSPSGGSVGIGFDIPADVASAVTRQLIAHGKVTRGYIGATVQTLSPDLAESLGVNSTHGALVATLTPGGPSQRAGLRAGDLIVGIDGHPIQSATDLTRRVALVQPGQDIKLAVLRSGRSEDVDVRAGLRPAEPTLASDDDDSGPQE